jgi:hypothetical protein
MNCNKMLSTFLFTTTPHFRWTETPFSLKKNKTVSIFVLVDLRRLREGDLLENRTGSSQEGGARDLLVNPARN